MQSFCFVDIAKCLIVNFIEKLLQTRSNAAVPNAISRKRFSDIFSNFHLANNADRYYKMHCLFDTLNCNFKKHFSACDRSIDKTMISYFYMLYYNQTVYMRQPIRFGFKLWCLVSTDGYSRWIIGEADTKLSNTGRGQNANAVLGLVEKRGLSSGFSVTFCCVASMYFLLVFNLYIQ